MNTTTATYSSQDVDIESTIAHIMRANARGAAKGLQGGFEFETTNEVRDGEIIRLLTVTGTPLSYGGWTFLAKIERVGESFITSTSPWLGEDIDRDLVKPGECEHCGYDRQRNLTFLVRHEDGRVLNVGSTCMKDFLGVDFSVSWIDLEDMVDRLLSGTYRERTWTFDHILRIAIAATNVLGFKRSNEPGSTREVIMSTLYMTTAADREMAATLGKFGVTDEQVAEVTEWLTAQSDSSNYIANLQVLAEGNEVKMNHLGLVASLPNSFYNSKRERIEKEAKAAAKVASKHIGQEGDKKVTTTGTVTTVRNCGSYSYNGPDSFLYIWITEAGEICKTFSTSSSFADVEEGDTVTITGTIKAHEEYNGEAQTAFTRCKVIA